MNLLRITQKLIKLTDNLLNKRCYTMSSNEYLIYFIILNGYSFIEMQVKVINLNRKFVVFPSFQVANCVTSIIIDIVIHYSLGGIAIAIDLSVECDGIRLTFDS